MFSTLAVSHLAMAESIEMPTSDISKAGMKYWIVKHMILDIDEMLRDQGIKANSCIYRSNLTKKDTAFKGLGPCLSLNFTESMTADDSTGTTYVWLESDSQSDNTAASPIEIYWRPPRGGLLKLIDQAVEMKFEKPLYWLRKKIGQKEEAEKIHYKEFIGGEIKIVLPNDEKTLEQLNKNGNPWVRRYLKDLHELDFKLKPTERKDGLVVHSGTLQAEYESQNTKAKKTDLTFTIKTNLNILEMDRHFSLKVKGNLTPLSQNLKAGVAHAP
ncbi:MAG: hypothetical protein ACXVCN_16685 [Bdellovibrio sp.]